MLPIERQLRIRDLREDRDLTQRQIASLLHISQTTYSRYESGAIEIPAAVLVQLAQLYDTNIEYLIGLTEVRKPYQRMVAQDG